MPRALFIGGDHDGKIIDVPEHSKAHHMQRAYEFGVQLYRRERFIFDDVEVSAFVFGPVNAGKLARRVAEFAEVPLFLLKG